MINSNYKKKCNSEFYNDIRLIAEEYLQKMWFCCMQNGEIDAKRSPIKTSILHEMIEVITKKCFFLLYEDISDFHYRTEKNDINGKGKTLWSKYKNSCDKYKKIDLEITRITNNFMLTIFAKAPLTSINKNLVNYLSGFVGELSGFYNDDILEEDKSSMIVFNCIPLETINVENNNVRKEKIHFPSFYNYNNKGKRVKDCKLKPEDSKNLVEINLQYTLNIDFSVIKTKNEFKHAILNSKNLISVDMKYLKIYIDHFLYFILKKQNEDLAKYYIVEEPLIKPKLNKNNVDIEGIQYMATDLLGAEIIVENTSQLIYDYKNKNNKTNYNKKKCSKTVEIEF